MADISKIFLFRGNLKELNASRGKKLGLEYKFTEDRKVLQSSLRSIKYARETLRRDLLERGYAGVIDYYQYDGLKCGDTSSYVTGIPVMVKK